MDRTGVAEMSCIAGLGGDVKPLVRTARQAAESGRRIVVLDGCPLQCARHTMARHEIEPDLHWDLSLYCVPKRKGEDFAPSDATRLEPLLEDAITELSNEPLHLKGTEFEACDPIPHYA